MTTHTGTRRKSAVDRRDIAAAPYVKVLDEPKSAAFPAGRMLIASPRAVHDVVSSVPDGRVIAFGTLRNALAAQFGADYTCPITTGIFLRIAADASEEERQAGATQTTPWWRVVRDDGSLFEKLPGGRARQAKLLAAEGHQIDRVRGVPTRVADVDAATWRPRRKRARMG
jgi:alkylated DNA nucleotide flippase Atl1